MCQNSLSQQVLRQTHLYGALGRNNHRPRNCRDQLKRPAFQHQYRNQRWGVGSLAAPLAANAPKLEKERFGRFDLLIDRLQAATATSPPGCFGPSRYSQGPENARQQCIAALRAGPACGGGVHSSRGAARPPLSPRTACRSQGPHAALRPWGVCCQVPSSLSPQRLNPAQSG